MRATIVTGTEIYRTVRAGFKVSEQSVLDDIFDTATEACLNSIGHYLLGVAQARLYQMAGEYLQSPPDVRNQETALGRIIEIFVLPVVDFDLDQPSLPGLDGEPAETPKKPAK